MKILRTTRRSPGIDMTPMVDLGFLLVTFFMMATQFAPGDLVPVAIPHAVSETKLREFNTATILISKDGGVFFRMGKAVDMRSLGEMLNGKYELNLTEEELVTFSRQNGFGMPMSEIKPFLDLPEAERKKMAQPGIPMAQGRNELSDWLTYARITNPGARFLFKADRQTPYPVIKQVMDTMQDCNIDRFSLITDTEAKTEDAAS